MLFRIASIIDRVGQTATFRRASATYNATTRANTVTFVDTVVKCFVFNNSEMNLIGLSDQNTRYAAIAGTSLPYTPNVNQDKLVLDSVEYVIISADKRKIGNSPAMFVLGIVSNGE
jgi:hypothetical protein